MKYVPLWLAFFMPSYDEAWDAPLLGSNASVISPLTDVSSTPLKFVWGSGTNTFTFLLHRSKHLTDRTIDWQSLLPFSEMPLTLNSWRENGDTVVAYYTVGVAKIKHSFFLHKNIGFLFCFGGLLFLLSYTFFSTPPPLLPSPVTPMLLIYSGDLDIFFFLCRCFYVKLYSWL